MPCPSMPVPIGSPSFPDHPLSPTLLCLSSLPSSTPNMRVKRHSSLDVIQRLAGRNSNLPLQRRRSPVGTEPEHACLGPALALWHRLFPFMPPLPSPIHTEQPWTPCYRQALVGCCLPTQPRFQAALLLTSAAASALLSVTSTIRSHGTIGLRGLHMTTQPRTRHLPSDGFTDISLNRHIHPDSVPGNYPRCA